MAIRALAISHTAAQISRLWRWLWHSGAIVPFVFLPASVLLIIIDIQVDTAPSVSERRKVCDRAVDALLNSRDPIEVQRAGILIENLDCSVSRRLGRP